MSWIVLVATGCMGTVQVEDPTPIVSPTPPVALASLDVATAFQFGDLEGGCELNSTGEIWVELASLSGVQEPQILVQSCGAQVSFVVEPVPDAVVMVRSVPSNDTFAFDNRALLPAVWFSTDWISLGDVDAGATVAVDALLQCQSPEPGACGWSNTATLTVIPSFQTFDGAYGCEVNPSGSLWLELGGDAAETQTFYQPCLEGTTFFVNPVVDPWFQVRSEDFSWESDPDSDGVPDQQEPWYPAYYASDWTTMSTLGAGSTTTIEVDLFCYDVADDGCGGA